MGLSAATVRRIIKARKEVEAMKKPIVCPIYYEVHSGIMDYRRAIWVIHDPVDIFTTLKSAREELAWRRRYYEDNNAAYIVRRYRHGSKIETNQTN